MYYVSGMGTLVHNSNCGPNWVNGTTKNPVQLEDFRALRRIFGADDFASLPKSGTVDPKSIRFSQDSIAGNFKNGGSVQELAAQLKAGKVDPSTIPPIRIVVKDGKVFTLDNRRLRAFQEAGIDIPFVKLDHIPTKQLDKFSTINEGVDIIIRGSQR